MLYDDADLDSFPISKAAGSERAIRPEVRSTSQPLVVTCMLFLSTQFPSQPPRLKESSHSRLFDIVLRDVAIPTRSPDLDTNQQRRGGRTLESDHRAEGNSPRRQPSAEMGERRKEERVLENKCTRIRTSHVHSRPVPLAPTLLSKVRNPICDQPYCIFSCPAFAASGLNSCKAFLSGPCSKARRRILAR